MTINRLEILQNILKNNAVEYFLLPTTDEFLSEYSPPFLQRLLYISGFSGSNGFLLVNAEGKHAFFTDGRYTIQARHELAQSVQIFNLAEKPLVSYLSDNSVKEVAYDPKQYSAAVIDTISKAGVGLKPIKNPVDDIWENRPKAPSGLPFLQNSEYISDFPQVKLTEIITKFAKNADCLLIPDPESVCYLLNIRGNDIPCNPVILSYLLIDKEGKLKLFTYKPSRFDYIKESLGLNIEFLDITNFEDYIAKLSGKTVAYNILKSQDWFRIKFAKYGIHAQHIDDGILNMRAAKKDNEIMGAKKAHILDAVAVIKAIYRIKSTASINEIDAGNILYEERKKSKEFLMESFPSICGYGSNGAIIHYRATEASAKPINLNNMLLLDSGGQYESGTTDITRTIWIGAHATDKAKNLYTSVLKGHIALLDGEYNSDVTGEYLDNMARSKVNEAGYDYDHGTGHGVGNLLNVHEGPFSISRRNTKVKLMPNMILSNEPGIYIENEFGIRIENLMFSKLNNNKFTFESLTLVPYEKELINLEMLDAGEINWLKTYYKSIESVVLPKILDNDIKKWLINQLSIIDFQPSL